MAVSGSQAQGAAPLVEHQTSHEEFLAAVAPSAVVVKLDHVRRILKDGQSADEWAPAGTATIVTSTIPDRKLRRLDWETERELIAEFDPDYYIPADYPVYADDPPETRRENVLRCARGTAWLAEQLPASVEIVPLIKGATADERAICERTAARLDADLAAVSATQFFTNPRGGQWPALKERLEAIHRETNGQLPLLTLGLLSATYLAEAPASVVGASGLNQWRRAVRPRSRSPAEMQAAYEEFAAEVCAALEGDDDTGDGDG